MSIDVGEEFATLDAEWLQSRGYTYSEWCEFQHLQAVVEPYLTMKQKIKRYKNLRKRIQGGSNGQASSGPKNKSQENGAIT